MALDQEPLLQGELSASAADEAPHSFDLWRELGMQLYIAGPMICVNVLQFLIPATAVMLVGHLGRLALSSTSLATASCSVSGFTIMMGMAAALETLCGQAYGARQYRMLGIHLQRAIVVLTLTSLPIAILWLNMEPILVAVGQDPTIAAHSGAYARFLIPGLFAFAIIQPLAKFLQTQSAVVPMALCSLATLLVHIPVCWFFLYYLQVGTKGAALSVSISYWLNALFFGAYVLFSDRCRQTWDGFSREAFGDFSGFFKLAAPSAVMICLETWSFEIVTLLSGLLPNPQLETSAFTSIMNTLVTGYMVPLSLGAAASTRAANELGAGFPKAARAAVCLTLCLGVIDSTIVVSTILSLRTVLGWAFSNEEEVVAHVADLFRVAIFIAACDPIQGVLTGVARGCGWQAVGALANLLAFYVIGLPIAYIAAFVYGLHGKGLWIGIACGNAAQTLTLCVITICMSWEKQAENARRRVLQVTLQTDGDTGNGYEGTCKAMRGFIRNESWL